MRVGASEVHPTRPTLQENVMLEFFRIFRQYRRHHGTRYALQRAWGIAFKQEQF
jgi:hypothetical protein